MKGQKKAGKAFRVTAILFYLLAAIMLYKGYDKMTNYVNSEYYPSHSVNAYVGGDAYNYIINGNYSTGFFVLSAGFTVTGTLLLSTGALLNARRKELLEAQATPKAEAVPEREAPYGN